MLATKMWLDVPRDYVAFCPGDWSAALRWLKVVMTKAPQFMNDVPELVGVPITSMLYAKLTFGPRDRLVRNRKRDRGRGSLHNGPAQQPDPRHSRYVRL